MSIGPTFAKPEPTPAPKAPIDPERGMTNTIKTGSPNVVKTARPKKPQTTARISTGPHFPKPQIKRPDLSGVVEQITNVSPLPLILPVLRREGHLPHNADESFIAA